jgi:transposase
MEHKDARSLSPSAQQEIRIRAVHAVLEGITQVEVAQLFGVTRQVLSKWVRTYKEHGEKGLKAQKQGRPKGAFLKGWQASKVIRKIVGTHPDQLRLPGLLWTRESVGNLIENMFDIRLSKWTVGRYLKRWGFLPKSPQEGPMRKIQKLCADGWRKNIRPFADKPRRSGPGSTGATRWASDPTTRPARHGAFEEIPQSSKTPENASIAI